MISAKLFSLNLNLMTKSRISLQQFERSYMESSIQANFKTKCNIIKIYVNQKATQFTLELQLSVLCVLHYFKREINNTIIIV